MELWLFFTIFGAVIFIPSSILFLVLGRFRNTIVVLFKENGSIVKVIIDNKILETGEIKIVNGKKLAVPIKVSKDEIYYGKWRRWIVKSELHSSLPKGITKREVEEYLNSEDLIKLYLAGKFKDTLILLLGITIFCVIVGAIVNGYLTSNHQCLDYTNSSSEFIKYNVRQVINEVFYNATPK